MKEINKANPKPNLIALVGRLSELEKLRICIRARKNILLEGPVGVGKTHLALAVIQELNNPIFRVDGDSRYSEQKLSGWFDPPAVLKEGYTEKSFVAGPLVEAMRSGGILFINELNRLPEGVQNILLPAIDEGKIMVPRLGEVLAKPGFLVIATQNPKEFVATSHLSEAILDRFELVGIDYQSEEEEVKIVFQSLKNVQSFKVQSSKSDPLFLSQAAVKICRLSREHPRVRRGASVRAALSIAELTQIQLNMDQSFAKSFSDAFLSAVLMAMPTRIEIERDVESDRFSQDEMEDFLRQWVKEVLNQLGSDPEKKNSSTQIKS